MSDDSNTDDGAEIRELLIHPYAWAIDSNAQDALKKLLAYWNGSFQETERIQQTTVRGEVRKHSPYGHVEADEVLDSVILKVDGDELATLKHHLDEADLMADRLLNEAEEIEQEVAGDGAE